MLAEVVAQHLCCGCGACVAVCPVGALSMRETPAGHLWASESGEADCTECGLCLQVCPGSHLDPAIIPPAEDPFIGPVKAAYWAWAKDARVRFEGTSGGVVTALLCALLQAGVIDGALLVRWTPADPLRPEAFVARTVDEIRSAHKSKYCPVALNEMLKQSKAIGDSVAMVGLPCHFHGLENMRRLSSDVARNVVLKIGLFCDRTLSVRLIEQLLHAKGVSPEQVEAFEYRDKRFRGWPGDVYIKPRGRPALFVDRRMRMGLKDPFTSVRCRLCFDKFNVLSDISLGDGYGAEPQQEGVSAVVVRTATGENALQAAASALTLQETSVESVFAHQQLQARKDAVLGFTAAFQELKPHVTPPLPEVCKTTQLRTESSEYLRILRDEMKLESIQDPDAAMQFVQRQVSRTRRRMAIRRLLQIARFGFRWLRDLFGRLSSTDAGVGNAGME